MNYFGKFDATVSDALGQHPGSHVFSETVHATHVPSDAVIVPDAQLLFGAEFKRTGVDLVLSGDNRELVLHDYFKGEHRAPLASPDGAHLTGDLVTALAGEVQYAQADGNASVHQVIGHVTKLTGTATAVRNGVSIILNNGDNVEKGDVVASGSDSTLGVTFIDGTVFGLSSNARMVLNEMVYDPNGSNNSSLLSLVAGTITFVAGETAKHGDMKIDTPVATMGIRGTAVLVEIDFNVPGDTPDAKFQVLVEPDGTTGSYILFDKTTLTPLAVVDHAGLQINISNGIMSQTLAPLSPEIQKLITDVFSLKFSDTSTKSLEHFTDSIVPNDIFGPLKFAGLNSNAPPIPVIVNLVVANSQNSNNNASTKGHIPDPPVFQQPIANANLAEQPNITGSKSTDVVGGLVQYFDVNASDHDTVAVKFSSFTYQNAGGQDVTGSLNNLQLADIAKVEADILVVEPFNLNSDGSATAIWSYSVQDRAFDFLAAGEKLTLTYTATVDNNYLPLDQTSSQTFTITITGTNDVPVITTSQQNISFAAAGTDTKGGDLIPNTATSGQLIFTDPDLTDTHTVAVKMTSALLDGQSFAATVGQAVIDELAAAVTASIAKGNDSTGSGSGTIDWTLANLQVYLADLVPANESLVLTYAVTVTDSQGATSVQDIVVTIGGNNSEVLAWIDTSPIPPGGALWSTALNWEGDLTPDTSHDVVINNNQVNPKTPTFPVTVNADGGAKSLTMTDFSDGTGVPTLDVEANVTLTIAGALNLNTDTATDPDTGAPLVLPTAEAIINNWGTLSVGGIAEFLKSSVLNNSGKITFAEAGNFGDQSSVTNSGTIIFDQGGSFTDQSSVANSGTIEVVSDTLNVEVSIANSVTTMVDDSPVTVPGTIQVDGGAALKLTDGATITNGQVTLGSLSMLDVEKGTASLPAGTPDATLDGVQVIGTNKTDSVAASTIEVGASGAAILMLDDGTSIQYGDLKIAANSELDIESAGGATLNGVSVINSGTIQVDGVAGGPPPPPATIVTLVLDGGTTITDGTLVIHDLASPDQGIVEIETGGATFDDLTVTNNNELKIDPSVTLTLEGGTTIKGGTIDDAGSILVTASSEIENATVNGGGDLTVTGGTLTLSKVMLDDVTLAGSFTNADTLTIDETVTLNGATIDGGTIDDTGTISGYGAISSAITGPGALTASGGTLTLSGLNTYSGTTTIDSGAVLAAGAAETFSANSAVTDNGELDLGTTDQTIAALNGTNTSALVGSFSGTGMGPAVLTVSNGGSFAGTIEDGSAGVATALTLTAGTLTLTGDNTYSGATTINGGSKLVLSDTGSISDSSDVIDDGTFDISGLTSDTSIVTLSGGGGVTLGGNTLTLSEASTTFGGVIGGTGGLTLTAGTETLTGDNSYSGATTIDGGSKLVLSDAGSISDSSDVIDDGTFDISGLTSDTSIVTLSGDGGVALGGNTLTLSEASTTFGGVIGGTGGLTVDGTGTETLTGLNSYGGVTTIGPGETLALSGTGSIANSSNVIDNGTFDISKASLGASIVTLSGDGGVTLGGNTLTLSEASTTFGGVIGGTGGLTLTAGTETLTGDNSYGGATTIDGGSKLVLSDAGSISDSSDVIDDGTFDISGLTSDTSIVTLSGDGGVTLGGNTLTLSEASTTFGGVIGGTGGLTVDGTGTETLTGLNTYSGVTTIGSGETLALSGRGSIANSNDVLDDGTFDISKTSLGASIVTLSGDGVVTLGAQTLTLLSANGTFSGGIGGTGGLTVDGTGTETLSGLNSYGGVTTIGSGETLALSGTGSIANSSNVVDVGTFDISKASLGASIVTLSGNGAVKLGAETLTLTDASTTFSGTISSTSGTLSVAGGTLTLGTMILDNVTLSGSFGNSGTLTIDDTATLNGATITGGTIDIVGVLDSTGTSFIDGASIINMNHIDVVSGTLNFDPTPFTNAGIFEVQGSSEFSDEVVTNSHTVGNVTTNGTIQVDQGGTLTIDSSTITGGKISNSGTIDVTAASTNSTASSINNTFSFVNAGTVNADGAELDLVRTIINNAGGTFKTTGKGIIDLENTAINGGMLSGTIATATGNTSGSTLNGVTLALSTLVTAVVGVLELTGNISSKGEFDATTGVLDLDNATINGGTFGGSGTIATISDFNTLNGVTIAGGTTVKVADGTVLDLVGTISDHGTIALGASGHFTGLEISGNVSLTGGGNVTMTDDSHNFIASDGSAATLTNSDTISAAGTIGDSHLTLVNSGTIDATGTHALIIDTGVNSFTLGGLVGNLLVTNNVSGVLEASAGHTLQIDDNVLNNGLIESGNPGGHSSAFVDITGNITGTGSIEIFNNATMEIGGTVSSGQTVTFGAPGGPVATNGLLVLEDSHDFHGTIVGLTENSVESQENQVDLSDLAYLGSLTHAHFNSSNDTVTVSNFFDSVTLHVSGNSSGSFEVSSDGHGGTLLDDPAASGTVTVDSNQTLDISAASSAAVDFTNSTGTTGALVLDDSKDFTGSIVGFTGDGTTANSDLIDITDVNIADVATNKTTYTDHGNDTGTLTLYNANGQALDSINFDGAYQLANFTIESDGDGGTLIVDPPVSANGQSSANTHVASNQNPIGTQAADGFVFNFAGPNHAPTTDFHPDLDAFRLGGPTLTNLHTASNAAPDQGNFNMPLGSEGHDHFGLGFGKVHLHSADFHFV